MKTRAAVCREFGAPLTIENVELAEPGPGEIRVKIKACAICHSDIFYWEGAWGGDLPAVYGHEAAGIVEAVGPGVTRVKAGDPVVATLIRSCGFCPSCSGGVPVFCEEVFDLDRESPLKDRDGATIVHGMRIGAFAEHVVVHHSQVAPIPADMKLDVASLIACGVLTGFGAVVNTADVGTGASVVVIGCGGVGLNSVQGARVAGAAPIIAVDVAEGKLEAARAFGATHAINAKPEDVAARVAEITDGRKADFVFVTVGVARRGGAGDLADETQRRDGAGRHAALRRPRDLRSRLARRRRPTHPRLQDGLGATAGGRAEARRALPRRQAETRRTRHRALSRSSASTKRSPPRERARRYATSVVF